MLIKMKTTFCELKYKHGPRPYTYKSNAVRVTYSTIKIEKKKPFKRKWTLDEIVSETEKITQKVKEISEKYKKEIETQDIEINYTDKGITVEKDSVESVKNILTSSKQQQQCITAVEQKMHLDNTELVRINYIPTSEKKVHPYTKINNPRLTIHIFPSMLTEQDTHYFQEIINELKKT
jgi:hypothetical protein